MTHADGEWALFLAVDGTLLAIAETPQGVHVPENVKRLLLRLSLRLDGALALVSSRSLADLDRLFAPLRFCASGVHGCERREASGSVMRAPIDAGKLAVARSDLQAFVERHEGLMLEDKGYSLAVHFRRAPHLSGEVHSCVKALCRHLGARFEVLPGKCVFELRPVGWTKGAAIDVFMTQAPFAGRTPVFIGDDATDEDGFAAVSRMGGICMKVGDASPSLARHRFSGVPHVLHWLQTISERPFDADVR